MDRNTKMGDSYTFYSKIFPVNKCTVYAKSHPCVKLSCTLRQPVLVEGPSADPPAVMKMVCTCVFSGWESATEHVKCVWCS